MANLVFSRTPVAPAEGDEWMDASCAIGSVSACVARFKELRAAGVDEIACYGSSPADNAAEPEAPAASRSAAE